MRSKKARGEVERLQAQVAALKDLLEAYERKVVGQGARGEASGERLTDQSDALRSIATGTALTTGEDFFRSLVFHLASVLKVRYVGIGTLREPGHDRIVSLACWADGTWAENVEYELAGTPCATVINQGFSSYPEGVQRLFPDDRRLADMGAESYCGTPLLDRSGRALGVLEVLHDRPMGSNTDIGPILNIVAARAAAELERQQAEEALHEGEARYRMLVEHISDLVCEVSEDSRFLYLSPNYAEMLGYEPSELLGRHIFELVHSDDLPGVLVEFKKENGTAAFRYRHHNGAWRWIEGTAKWFRTAGGERRAVVVSRDITVRKRVEEALLESERRFRALVENTKDVIARFNREHRYEYINPACGRYLPLTPKEFRGKTHRELGFPEEKVRFWEETIERVFETGQPQELEIDLEGIGGKLFFNWRLYPEFEESGRVKSVVAVSRDVTEQKRLEAQLRQAQKMEAIGRLAGGVAHDFNNLLTAIMGYGQLLLYSLGPDDPHRGHVEQIKQAGERAAALTQQLLGFSRKQVQQPKVIDVNAIVANIAPMLRRLIGEHIELVTVLAPQLGQVKADPSQMEQIIMNLAINARDAMSEGGRLTIETSDLAPGQRGSLAHSEVLTGPAVQLTVSDSGQGMDAETLTHLFEPFFTTKEQGKGTGLGLATVYGIVTQSGGTIEVDSEPGAGTTFTIVLPRVDAGSHVVQGAGACAGSTQGTETILLVEDESVVRDLARDVLKTRAYQVLEASNGREGLRLCETHEGPIHLLLTDVVMPGMNGRQLAEQAQVLRPSMKVIFMSGYTDDAVLRHGVLEAGTAFLQKPFLPEALARKVREVLDAARDQHP